MALYFFSYDLRKSRNYQPLYDELEKFNAVRILESQWCFKRENTSVEELRDFFKKLIDTDDGLCLSAVTSWATSNTDGNPKQIN